MSKTIYVTSQSDCSQGQQQSNSTTVRLQVIGTPPNTTVALRTNAQQQVACITQELQNLSPSEQTQSSLVVVLWPSDFVPHIAPIGSPLGSAQVNEQANEVVFFPPPEGHTDQWDFEIFTETHGHTTLVNRLRIRLIHI